MTKQHKTYKERRLLRTMEKGWSAFLRGVNRITAVAPKIISYNPFYHLGTLTIFLLIILTVTGLYLVIFYRPGADRAYISVANLSGTWFNLLIRTVHRYTSDAIIVISLLHALKMFVSDRFWGSRWFAWVSGWVMMGALWVMGLMGYWLIWDQPAQWLTEYFLTYVKGPFAHSILAGGTELAATTYALFVIILFIHAFIPPLILVFVLIHVVRLSRSRYWSPQWLMISTAASLILISIWRPAPLSAPANLDQLVTTTYIDWFYMGFLPLNKVIGAPIFWGASLLMLAIAFILPWVWSGKQAGPAEVIKENCTGCSACALSCPYDAIQMSEQDKDAPHKLLALVHANKCVGCGICVAACNDNAIELEHLHSTSIRDALHHASAALSEPAVTIYACERHEAMGTLPPMNSSSKSLPFLDSRINVGTWTDGNGEDREIMTAVMPCVGMLHSKWAAEIPNAGKAGAIVVSCPNDDCTYREGTKWISKRIQQPRILRNNKTHHLELPPGSNTALLSVWRKMVDKEDKTLAHAATIVGTASKEAIKEAQENIGNKLRYLSTGAIILLFVFIISVLVNAPATNPIPERGQIRLVITHGGTLLNKMDNLDSEVAAKLPDNVDPSMVLGGERHPVQLRVIIDGDTIFDETYDPRGLRNEGAIFAQEALWLTPDEYEVEVLMMDDAVEWKSVFDDTITITDTNVSTLIFDETTEQFVLRTK